MARVGEGVGRPSMVESRDRTRRFLRLLADGATPLEAARAAGVKPERVLRLLGEPEFETVYIAVRRGLGATGALVEDTVEAA